MQTNTTTYNIYRLLYNIIAIMFKLKIVMKYRKDNFRVLYLYYYLLFCHFPLKYLYQGNQNI